MKKLSPQEIDELVREAESIISRFKTALIASQSGRAERRGSQTSDEDQSPPGKTQMSNAIDAVQQTRSIPMFINWVRYQMAREEENLRKSSSHKKGQSKSGKELVSQEEKSEEAQRFWTARSGSDTFAEALAKAVQKIQSTNDRETSVEKVILFLGFMRRALVAINHLDAIPAQLKGGEGR